jgi:hypothetical protein
VVPFFVSQFVFAQKSFRESRTSSRISSTELWRSISLNAALVNIAKAAADRHHFRDAARYRPPSRMAQQTDTSMGYLGIR